ncbi:MAG: cysteine desulfurase [Spirochaetales bacterium]|nr:cysteine desulfurase [Spirochaetales bacterium]
MEQLTSVLPVHTIRKDFPILDTCVYFDNAATSQKPVEVINSISNFYKNTNANVHRSIHRLGEKATAKYEDARERVRNFINARSVQEIIFTSGTTDSINLVASAFAEKFINEGDSILVTELEHHSNLVPWQLIASRKKATLCFVPLRDDLSYDTEALEKLPWHTIKIAAVSHISNVLGIENNIKSIISHAHGHDVPVLIDAAQSAGHIPIDVQAMDCDFLAFSGHKMCGPLGTGVLYGRERLLEQLPPYRGGGDMIHSVWKDKSSYAHLPCKFEAGTPNIVGAIGLGKAMNYLSRIGITAISDRIYTLSDYFYKATRDIDSIQFLETSEKTHGIFSFVHKIIHPHDLAQYLDSREIAIRAGHHCAQPLHRMLKIPASARVSLYFYNTESEIDCFRTALEEAERFFYV